MDGIHQLQKTIFDFVVGRSRFAEALTVPSFQFCG